MSLQESSRSLHQVLPPIKGNASKRETKRSVNFEGNEKRGKGKPLESIPGTRVGENLFEHSNLPSASELGSLEAQRVISVVDELILKVSLQGLVPEVIDKRQLAGFSPEIIAQLQTYRHLCNQVDSGVLVLEEGASATDKLKASCRSLKRLLSQNPILVSKLQSLKQAKKPSRDVVESLVQQLRDILYERLCTAVEDDQQRRDTLTRISTQEYRMTSELQVLLDELDNAKQERSSEVAKCNVIIRQLKEELRELKQQAESNLQRMTAKSQNNELQDRRATKQVQETLEQEIVRLKANIEEARRLNREDEVAMRKRIFKIETEVENWIHKYDLDMEEKQVEIDDITSIYMEEKQELDQLTGRFTELKTEYDSIMEMNRKKQQEEKEAQELLATRTAAAIKIQAIWRGYKVRANIKKRKTKGNSSKSKRSAKSK